MLIFGGVKNFGWFGDTVDGRNPAPVEVGNLFHYLQDYVHPRWCRVSSINSIRVCYTSRNFPKMASGFSFIYIILNWAENDVSFSFPSFFWGNDVGGVFFATVTHVIPDGA